MMTINNKQYYNQLSKVFSAPQLLDIARNNPPQKISRLIEKAQVPQPLTYTLGAVFDGLYQCLRNEYRCEYVYKNEIAQQLLLERHSLNEAILFTEFRCIKSKADVLIVNGTTTVYEIKTELDTFERLDQQLSSYHKLFDKIFVVVPTENFEVIKSYIPENVGIIALDAELCLKLIRDSESNVENVIPANIFSSLRKPEYISIIQEKFGYVPDVPNTLIYDECKTLFCTLSPKEAHDALVKVLRARMLKPYQIELVKSMPDSLKFLSLTSSLSIKECEVLNTALTTVFSPLL